MFIEILKQLIHFYKFWYYYVTLCSVFWDIQSLGVIVKNIRDGSIQRSDMNNYYPTQESYLLGSIMTLDKTWKPYYSSSCYLSARTTLSLLGSDADSSSNSQPL